MGSIVMAGRRALALAAAAALACSKSDGSARNVPLAAADRGPGVSGPGAADGGASPLAAAPAELNPASKTALDSGNALFRKNAYGAALEQYRLAAHVSPAHAAPLFGIYMVARAQKNSVLADSALRVIRSRAASASSGLDDAKVDGNPEGDDDPPSP